ncbi:TetR/AcrR family transcriptional regulator [Ornithinimicrobium tianjinense]|uniref:TetR/AcrR family transcriptional regulator n=1 Tax=Ornithinimicrobium tianjinense TaxID=1195761 RepID=UPI001669FE0A|nr:TetR/AcrR family transcriptional regulator [Ornithinimicrobium tianjinense]
MVEAAVEIFSLQGYQATTFAQLAERAGVSVETVQKHGPKSALLQAAVEMASFGVEGENDFFDSEAGRSVLAAQNPDELAAAVGQAILAINAPSAGAWTALAGAAQGDPELRSHHLQMLGLIRAQVDAVLRWVDGRGWLRQDVSHDELVEAICVITSVESYVRFVELDGKTPEEYRAFVTRAMRETVLAP